MLQDCSAGTRVIQRAQVATYLQGASPSQTRPVAGRASHALLQTHCSIRSSLRQCHGRKRVSIGRGPSPRTPPPRDCRVQAQSGHTCTSIVDRNAFYPHKMGPCGASPISKWHKVGPAVLSQHQEPCSSPGTSLTASLSFLSPARAALLTCPGTGTGL